jgi:hypothetical protein
MRFIIENYSFDKTAKTVTFTDFVSINKKGILGVVNATSGVVIYQPNKAGYTGTVLTNVLTLAYDTSAMNNADTLIIIYDDLTTGTGMAYGEVYASPQDFTATYTSNVTITITGAPFTVDDSVCFVAKIGYKPTGGRWKTFQNGVGGISITAAAGVITIAGAGTPFASGDTYRVIIFGQEKAYDPTTDTEKTSEQNPIWARYTDKENLIAATQTLTTSMADIGYEVDVRGYTRVVLWLTVTIGQALNLRFQALAKHTSAGTEEYNIPIKAIDYNAVRVNAHYYELDVDGNQLICLDWDCTGLAWIQFQGMMTTDAGTDATITAAYVTKMY